MSEADALPAAPPAGATWQAQLPSLIRVYGIIVALVLLLAVVTIGNPAFLSQNNLFNMASQWAPAGIMAVGMTFVILTGGFDLSVASAYSLCAVVAAYVGQDHAPLVAFAAAIAAGLVFGLANGILVAVVRINPFITTVGSADKAFLGSSGFTAEKGHSTPNPDDAQIKEAIMRVSDETYVLVDSSKYGHNCLTSFTRLCDVELTITDSHLSSSKAKTLEAAGATLRIADIRGAELNSDARGTANIKGVSQKRTSKNDLALDRKPKR